MVLEFRARNYVAEDESSALPRSRADTHPLASTSSSQQEEDTKGFKNNEFFDPLRGLDVNAAGSADVKDTSTLIEAATQETVKEWASFKKVLTQRFPVSKTITISSMSSAIMKTSKVHEKPSRLVHAEELVDQQKTLKDDTKLITREDYLSQLQELRDEIIQAWNVEDRVTSLKLSIKVARLLMDTSVQPFYPTVFVVATDTLDMLGDLVWERIKQKAEFFHDGTTVCHILDDFEARNISEDAKETCYNWFCKVGSIRELLPRIYLELAILPCWCFLLDQPAEVLHRLVMMMRGIADPLASIYCHLYLVHRSLKLPFHGPDATGYIIKCLSDINVMLLRATSTKETIGADLADSKKIVFSLMEPAIEYIMKCLMRAESQAHVNNVLDELGLRASQLDSDNPCASILLHHLLRTLPYGLVHSHAMEILHVIKTSNDDSISQYLNYRLLGIRLCEKRDEARSTNAVIDEVLEAVSLYDALDEYLMVVDAYMDIVLQNDMDNHLHNILDGILRLAFNKIIVEDELATLQSILAKLISHSNDLEDLFGLKQFLKILDIMHGNSRSVVYMQILTLATRKRSIRDPTIIKLLFEISQALHDATDIASIQDGDNYQPARLISRFVQIVDPGAGVEQHLTFLAECRGAFGSMKEVKETLVHSSNSLAIKALKDGRKNHNFVKSCIAFGEVTIPSISAPIRQLDLYIETAEVALLAGLISHSDGLVDSAVNCLENLLLREGSKSPVDMDGVMSSIQKLCGLLVMVPGNSEKGELTILKAILSLICSQLLVNRRMKSRIFCSIISLLAALSQNKLPYHAGHPEVTGNDLLFFGDSSYLKELILLTEFVLQKLMDVIEQETSQVARGNMALEACNCIASTLSTNQQVSELCTSLLKTAKMCLGANDKYLQSTIRYLDKRFAVSMVS